MAIYHASIKALSRGKGQSSVAAAAYRAGIDLTDTGSRKVHSFTNKKGVVEHIMMAPAGAPAWCSDIAAFWDANEQRETRANARLAREVEVSLPCEMDDTQRRALAIDLGQMLVDRYRAVVLVAIHRPSNGGDKRNHHVHLLMSAREVGPGGFGQRAGMAFEARKGQGAEEVKAVRALVSELINSRLAAAGLDARVDHRSLRAQSMDAQAAGNIALARELARAPGRHVGKALTAAMRRGDPIAEQLGLTSQTAAAANFAKAVEKFRSAGLLAPTPVQHDRAAARLERDRAAQDPRPLPELGPAPRPTPVVPGQGPSALGLYLSRYARIARSRGHDAEVLNSQAELIEEWIDHMNAEANKALASLEGIPGLRVEPVMHEAVGEVRRRRAGVYSTKSFFFEDSEALVEAIVDYAEAIRHPHEVRARIGRARAKLSELENSDLRARDHRITSARRALAIASGGASKPAKVVQDRRIVDTRRVMTEARERLATEFWIKPQDEMELVPLDEAPVSTPLSTERRGGAPEVRPRLGPMH